MVRHASKATSPIRAAAFSPRAGASVPAPRLDHFTRPSTSPNGCEIDHLGERQHDELEDDHRGDAVRP